MPGTINRQQCREDAAFNLDGCCRYHVMFSGIAFLLKFIHLVSVVIVGFMFLPVD